MNKVEPSHAIDHHLATLLCQELNAAEDSLLYNAIVGVSQALRAGHSCLDLTAVAEQPVLINNEEATQICFPALAELLAHLSSLPLNPTDHRPLVLDRQRLYLRRYWLFEDELARALAARLPQRPLPQPASVITQCLDELFPTTSSDIDWQRVAAAAVLDNQLTVLAGGPGTGKTYTVTRMLAALQQLHDETLVIQLAAPTGKAAQRLSESICQAKQQLAQQNGISHSLLEQLPEQASTLHRLLGVIPNSVQFRHNAQHPLALDVLVIDEVSMVDLPLMTRLFRALPAAARVIMVGDPEQLPSVAAGSVLSELAPLPHPGYSAARHQQLSQRLPTALPAEYANKDKHAGYDHLVLLQHSRRFAAGGEIGELAQLIIAGESKRSWERLQTTHQEIACIDTATAHQQVQRWCEQYYRAVFNAESAEAALAALNDFRMLTATRGSLQGVTALNEQVEQWAVRVGFIGPHETWYHGRPIMVTENHYGLGLFNGDLGIAWWREGRIQVAFEDVNGNGLRWYNPGRLPNHETVWAMTIHKTQGSEFKHIALILPEHSSPILTRELLYTGLTRARQFAFIMTGEAIWKSTVSQRVQRYSALAERVFSAARTS